MAHRRKKWREETFAPIHSTFTPHMLHPFKVARPNSILIIGLTRSHIGPHWMVWSYGRAHQQSKGSAARRRAERWTRYNIFSPKSMCISIFTIYISNLQTNRFLKSFNTRKKLLYGIIIIVWPLITAARAIERDPPFMCKLSVHLRNIFISQLHAISFSATIFIGPYYTHTSYVYLVSGTAEMNGRPLARPPMIYRLWCWCWRRY